MVLDAALIVICVLSALVMIFLILLHSGRGGGLSDMFGGGQLDRLTIITGIIFGFSTVILALRLQP